jgi:hypothetical protein
MSDTIKALPQLSLLRKGMPLPRGTATAELNASARRITDGARAEAEIDIVAWLGGTRSVQATAQVVGLGSYGKTLTVLTCPSLQDETYQEDDRDGEEDLAVMFGQVLLAGGDQLVAGLRRVVGEREVNVVDDHRLLRVDSVGSAAGRQGQGQNDGDCHCRAPG